MCFWPNIIQFLLRRSVKRTLILCAGIMSITSRVIGKRWKSSGYMSLTRVIYWVRKVMVQGVSMIPIPVQLIY